jgi:hypothetical protein
MIWFKFKKNAFESNDHDYYDSIVDQKQEFHNNLPVQVA